MSKLKPLAVVIPAVALVGWLGYTFWQAYQPQADRMQGQIEA
jgi:HlyD family secretion protein